ncbi:pterin 4 alpha carbinolamine dehydratase-domain-containing protein [Xylaria bambusicola]|uniref:pterin 4 alpha carbinolamine dehydratase-domain-containing protein n=1 Tax=Xylaria bambusicola TaxID=326684 RepID=UPI002007DDDB|nr:pterin 4 alpha carbinolamine dehydratase-domain-containing protein [Xylaria bambusicola]KAI0516826.1 pterin 4 alpha carbinolamine dehydratase-domain-containing protein [Xylaria bambusicola]
MFARHASLPLRHLSAVASRGAALPETKVLTLRMRQTTGIRESPFAFTSPSFQMSRCQSSSSDVAAPNDTRINFAAGADEATLMAALQDLLDSVGKGGRWTLIPSGQGLERGFRFKNFAKTWDFMTAVSLQCKLKNHHPEWSNVYNTTHIRWTTHNPAGLSAKDVELAQLCDALARDFGEVVTTDNESGSSGTLKQVTERVVGIAGDCCTPKTAATT